MWRFIYRGATLRLFRPSAMWNVLYSVKGLNDNGSKYNIKHSLTPLAEKKLLLLLRISHLMI